MPAGAGYAMEETPGVPMRLRRQPARKRSHVNTELRPRTAPGNGKFGGLPGGPSGGTMGSGGRRKMGSRY